MYNQQVYREFSLAFIEHMARKIIMLERDNQQSMEKLTHILGLQQKSPKGTISRERSFLSGSQHLNRV